MSPYLKPPMLAVRLASLFGAIVFSTTANATIIEAVQLSDTTTESIQTGYSLNPYVENLEYWFDLNNVVNPSGEAIDVTNDQTQAELFYVKSDGTIEIEYLGIGYAAFHSPFGFFTYEGDPFAQFDTAFMSYYDPLFIQNEADNSALFEFDVFAGSWLGFYLDVNGTGTMLSTLNATNPGGVDNALIYATNTGYTLAFEDIPGGGDQDYEDLVVNIRAIRAIPAPSTLLLLAIGLLVIRLKIS